MDFDVVVIGSGFGGAVSACRLAEAGYKVLILERGRRWNKTNYPRQPGDKWLWSHDCPEKQNGWLDLRVFPHMSVAAGAAVGGGSLIYANVSCEAPPEAFAHHWPQEITRAELQPHYDRVAKFMNVQKVPANQWTERMKLMKEGAEKIGAPERFRQLELAVSFDPEWHYGQEDPHNEAKSRRFTNAQGVEQGTCVHLGNCDIGCEVDAKNTLDRNYIPWAEKHGAQVRELHLVSRIEPADGGYKIFYDRLDGGVRQAGTVSARIVIVAAGSLGSTELLLRNRDVTASLPNVSMTLGLNWSSNGDFLTPALYRHREISPSRGPTITSIIDFLDRSEAGQSFWVQDGGLPNLLGDFLKAGHIGGGLKGKLLVEAFKHVLRDVEPFRNIMPWFGQGVEASNGVLRLKPSGHAAEPALHLDWEIKVSRLAVQALVDMHVKLSHATGGIPIVPPTWSVFRDLVTPHPLGGCNMGTTTHTGVVNHACEVFGYKNLYVCDGAVLPCAIGVNPSRTIGAIAERTAKIIIGEAR